MRWASSTAFYTWGNSTERVSHLLQVTQYPMELAFGPGSPGPRAHPTHSGVTESAPSPVTQREAIHVSRRPEGTEHRAERWPAQRPCCPNGVESWCGVGVGRRLDQGRCLREGQPVGSLGLLAQKLLRTRHRGCHRCRLCRGGNRCRHLPKSPL